MKKKINNLSGKIVDVIKKKIYNGEIFMQDGVIKKIIPREKVSDRYILPGLIDAHVHIESSMLTPGEFARMAVRHGTVATVSDPHEIANVLGLKGVEFMIEDGEKVPLKFYFGAPSCVPATQFETTGGVINARDVEELMKRPEIYFLSEMMNYPGVIYKDPKVVDKLRIAKAMKKEIDGHAPGLKGEDLVNYVSESITTDHECISFEEAKEKIGIGMKIQIREGSAAKNFNILFPLIEQYPEKVMLCTDDIHPDDLEKGHINSIIKAGLEKRLDFFNLLRSATVNPAEHYGLNVGMLQENDPADFIIVDNLNTFNIKQTYIEGKCVYNNEQVKFSYKCKIRPNNFYKNPISQKDLKVIAKGNKIKVIEAINGELTTREKIIKANIIKDEIDVDIENDILKIVVLNRYKKAKPALGFIKGFGLKKGAIASSIAHDSHNIIAVGASDDDLVYAINSIIGNMGGVAISFDKKLMDLKLDIAGIMTSEDGHLVAHKYMEINEKIKQLGSKLHAPLMTLSFMGLLVIPSLKIGDKGLFDVNKFELTSLFVTQTGG
jgi:adenine deaminase